MGGSDYFNAEKHDFHDAKQELSRDDYRNMTRGEKQKFEPYFEGDAEAKVELGEPPIPDISQILAAPRPPKLGETQLVTLFVTEQADLKDTLIELARMANVDVEIDPAISGGIVFRAKDRPFNEVIERIANLAGLRYYMKNGVLRIEQDNEYVETYTLDFLSFDRESSSDVSINTNVLSAAGGGDGLNSGSTAAVGYSSNADFWAQLEASIDGILAHRPRFGVTTSGTGDTGDDESTFYVINRQGSTLTVAGTERQHKMINNYIQTMRRSMSSQVLIEAKIVEVTLDEQFRSGITWNEIFSSDTLSIANLGYTSVDVGAEEFTRVLLDAEITDNLSLDGIVDLTQQFGTTRTLSSPRIHAMNNQQAVLTFAKSLVYFTVDITLEEDDDDGAGGGDDRLSVDAEAQTVPVGIIMALQPSINAETGEITLSIRPTISRVETFKSDPSTAFALALIGGAAAGLDIENLVPEVEVRELDSIMRMRSGQVMVLGGLMQQIGSNNEAGVPGLSGVPWLGNAFKSNDRQEQVTELYFLIRATIVGGTSTVTPEDKGIYKKFMTDHRPLAF